MQRRRQQQHRDPVAHEGLPDRLRVPAQATFSAIAALLSQMRVERFPTVETRNRNHEVAAGITNETFHLALIVILLTFLVVAPHAYEIAVRSKSR